jgi:hypothetical protein
LEFKKRNNLSPFRQSEISESFSEGISWNHNLIKMKVYRTSAEAHSMSGESAGISLKPDFKHTRSWSRK